MVVGWRTVKMETDGDNQGGGGGMAMAMVAGLVC